MRNPPAGGRAASRSGWIGHNTSATRATAITPGSGSVRGSFVVVTVYPASHTFLYDDAIRANYFGVNPNLAYNFAGLDWSRLSPPPAAGVHPRILFGPEDLPAVRAGLRETEVGRLTIVAIRDILTSKLTGGTTSDGKHYGRDNRTSVAGLALGRIYTGLLRTGP